MPEPVGGPQRVAIATSYIESRYWTTVIEGIADRLRREDVVPLCFTLGARTPSWPATPDRHPMYQLVRPGNVHGLIVLAPAAFAEEASRFCARHADLPLVSVGQRIEGVPSVWLHNAAGVRAAMEHLVERCRRRRIAFLRGPASNAEAEARFRAYEDLCIELSLGYAPELVEQGDFTEASGYEAMQRLCVTHRDAFDALFAANDLMALGALRAARELGVAVPERVAVMGFDDLEARYGEPPLSTVRQPTHALGEQAAELMVRQLRGEDVPARVLFSPEVVVRATCGAAGGDSRAEAERRRAAPLRRSSFDRLSEEAKAVDLGALVRALGAAVAPQLRRPRGARELFEERVGELEALVDELAEREAVTREVLHAVREQALTRLAEVLAAPASRSEVLAAVEATLVALGVDATFLLEERSAGSAAQSAVVGLGRACEPGWREAAVADTRAVFAQVTTGGGAPSLWLVMPIDAGERTHGVAVVHGRVFDIAALTSLCGLLASGLRRVLELPGPPSP